MSIGSNVSRFDSNPDLSNPERTMIGANDFLRRKNICKRFLWEREMERKELAEGEK